MERGHAREATAVTHDGRNPGARRGTLAAMAMPGHCVLYRFRVDPDREDQFMAAWATITIRLRVERGALGSRLHRGPDGLWFAYAQWPSAEARAAAFAGPPIDEAARDQMRAAVVESLSEIVLDPVADYLALPASTSTSPPPAPWRLDYADGSGNHYLLTADAARAADAADPGDVADAADAADSPVTLVYTPVTRAQSSSGLYDGGPPRHAVLAATDPGLAVVWLQVLFLLDTAVADTARAKGTGLLTVTTTATRTAVLARGPGLATLDHLLATLAT